MTVAETRVIVEAFLGDHADTWLAEDAELHDADWPRCTRGRLSVTAWLARWSQVTPPCGWLVVGDGRAVAELALRREANPVINAVAILEVQGGEILRVRLYYDAAITHEEESE